ncbi:MAG: DUF1501 domain-containing protein [Ignavibacteriae bacterium]|nr:DUF1501 domain-containing protein [Ignavibacteriota bacterium]
MAIIGGGSTAFSLSGFPMKAFANPILNIKSYDGKILVVVQLKGGNDGLNTIIPFEDDLYYRNRPTLAIPKTDIVPITNTIGFHPNMSPLKSIFDDGKMSIIQNVGYENQNRSHFRSTDIWLTASDVDKYYSDGWLGRTLENKYPTYPETIPDQPMAVEIGSNQSLILESQHGGMGVSFDDPSTFSSLLKDSSIDEEPIPDTLAGEELRFLKQVAAQSIQYASVVKERADAGKNLVEYPSVSSGITIGKQIPLGTQLKIIAKLISGEMQTPVYVASLWGFDTHAQQTDDHASLLKEFSEAVAAFQEDMEKQGLADKVVLVTISEFGRRVAQNGGLGTDHGAAAPMIVIGNSVNGGIYGNQLDLANLDPYGDLPHEFDFRQVYSTIMQNHLGMGNTATTDVLKGEFATLPFLNSLTSAKNYTPLNYELKQNYPNPFNPTTKITYTIANSVNVSIILYDMLGRKVKTVVDKNHKPGTYSIDFRAKNNMASGTYIYQIRAGGYTESKKMILLK